MRKVIFVFVVLAMLLVSVPIVLAGPPEPPMQEFLVLYFQAEQEIAQARFDKPTRDVLYLLLDNAWMVWMYAEHASINAVANSRAIQMVKSVLGSIKEIKDGAPGFADAAASRFTLMMVFQYTSSCQMFQVSGGRYYICEDGAIYHWRGLSVEKWTNE